MNFKQGTCILFKSKDFKIRGEIMEKTTNFQLLEQFYRVGHAFRKFQFQNHKSSRFFGGFHKGQGKVLSILKVKPEITQKELVSILNIRAQSLGELLTKLESQGFITREPSKKDKRVTVVKLTEYGRKEIEKNDQISDPTEKIFDILNDDEKNNLYNIFHKLTKELEQNIDDDNFMEQLIKHREMFHENEESSGFKGKVEILKKFIR